MTGNTRPAKRADPLSLSRCCGPRRLSAGAVVDRSGSTSMPLHSQSISQPSMTGAPSRVASSCVYPSGRLRLRLQHNNYKWEYNAVAPLTQSRIEVSDSGSKSSSCIGRDGHHVAMAAHARRVASDPHTARQLAFEEKDCATCALMVLSWPVWYW